MIQNALDLSGLCDEADDVHGGRATRVLRSILLYLTDRRFEEGGLIVVTR